MITNNGEIIEVVPDLNTPEEIARSFLHDQDIKLVENKIEDLKQVLLSMAYNNDRLQRKFNDLYDEKWADTTLQNMKKELEEVRQDMYRGFPIRKREKEEINNWILKHDEEVHNNPNHYHGVSGGGYEYSFCPTGLGTIGYCICENCKHRAIKAKGEKYWDYLKELNGYVKFGDFG
jgi:hypothetical protein